MRAVQFSCSSSRLVPCCKLTMAICCALQGVAVVQALCLNPIVQHRAKAFLQEAMRITGNQYLLYMLAPDATPPDTLSVFW